MQRMSDSTENPAGQKPIFYTIADVAECLDVSIRTVRRWIDSRRLAAHRMGRVRRISDADLAAFLAHSRDPK
jgi:excisionase family DNA binding protein